jgi:hypothetical protein
MGSQSELSVHSELGQYIQTLSEYDGSIGERISELELGMYPNGHTPETDLNKAIKGSSDETVNFIQEYRWAMAVGAFPHQAAEEKNVLLAASEDALFTAAETYQPHVEPNFLVHFSRISDQVLREVFGQPQELPISIDTFDKAVIENHLQPLPPLAARRRVEVLEAAQKSDAKVAVVDDDGALQLASITDVKPLNNPFEHSIELTDEEIEIVQQYVNEVTSKGYDWKARIEGTRMMYRGGTPDALNLLAFGILSYEEIKHLPISVNTGTVLVEFDTLPYHILADVNNSAIIRQEEWASIKQDPLYREEWLRDGEQRSEYDMQRLRAAIGGALTASVDIFDTQHVEKKRAVPRRGYFGTGTVKYGSMIA